MMHSEQIKKIIAKGLTCEHLHIEGVGEYFEALVVSSSFVGKNRVQRQQKINALLRSYFDTGELHALSIKTLTPEEWNAQRG